MYIIFKKDGSVSEKQLADYVNQHSDGVNCIDIAIDGIAVDAYTADGNFKLPNNDIISQSAEFASKIKTSTGVYQGYRLVLGSAITEYYGEVALTIECFNSDKTTLFTYPVKIIVNETTGQGGNPITRDEYNALRAMMADYQLQFARSNMRSYDTLEEAKADLANLAEGQVILAKEDTKSKSTSAYQVQDGVLVGVSLDALAVDKFLKNENAIGTGSFQWIAETGTNADFKVRSETSDAFRDIFPNYKQIEDVFKAEGTFEGTAIASIRSFNDPYFRVSNVGGRTAEYHSHYIKVGNKKITIPNPSASTQTSFVLEESVGEMNGVASLDSNGKVPTSQLPSYVSDVLEFPTLSDFPKTGEANKIYIALDTNIQYRWGGTVYVEIGSSLALGETSETAWAGDKGLKNKNDIASLQTNKVDKIKSASPGTFYVYGAYVNTGSVVLDNPFVVSETARGGAIPTYGGFSELLGRPNQSSKKPTSENELITWNGLNAWTLPFDKENGVLTWAKDASTSYGYTLPQKSGTFALTSDLQDAGTSVTIRRW